MRGFCQRQRRPSFVCCFYENIRICGEDDGTRSNCLSISFSSRLTLNKGNVFALLAVGKGEI